MPSKTQISSTPTKNPQKKEKKKEFNFRPTKTTKIQTNHEKHKFCTNNFTKFHTENYKITIPSDPKLQPKQSRSTSLRADTHTIDKTKHRSKKQKQKQKQNLNNNEREPHLKSSQSGGLVPSPNLLQPAKSKQKEATREQQSPSHCPFLLPPPPSLKEGQREL